MSSEEIKWNNIGFIIVSDYRTRVLLGLAKPSIPSEIATQTNIEISHVSRTIQELRERGLVRLLVPEDQKKGRVYGLTQAGERVAKNVRDRNNPNGSDAV